MRYTVAKLHKALGEMIELGHGRKVVCINKDSFTHNCESDGVVILEVAGIGVRWINIADGDGGTKLNADGTESGLMMVILAGSAGANVKGELVWVQQ